MDDLKIRQADRRDATTIAPLFDAYRQFYGKTPDLVLAERFIRKRLENSDSLIFVAQAPSVADELIGFTQIYPTFSSLQCKHAWVLNDLFVAERARRAGVAAALMNAAADAARRVGVSSISLSTAHGNVSAQRLYTTLGYVLDEEFRTYSLAVTPA